MKTRTFWRALRALAVVCLLAEVGFAQLTLQIQNGGTPIDGGTFKKWGILNFSSGCTHNATTGAIDCTMGSGMADPGGNGIVYRSALNTTAPATYTNVVNLWASGSCTGFLKSDGTCSTPVPSLDTVTNPAAPKNFDMGSANFLTFHFSANSSTNNLATFTDFATNTGNGYLGVFSTAATSAMNGIKVSLGATSSATRMLSLVNNGVEKFSVDPSGNVVVAGTMTFGSIGTSTVLDANGAPFIVSSATASAVDSITITNAATGNPATVTIASTGSDTNINTKILAKGSGVVQLGSTSASVTAGGVLTVASCSGCGGATASLAWQPASASAISAIGAGQNSTSLTSMWVPNTVTCSTMVYYVQTVDAGASLYDIGIFSGTMGSSNGTLVANIGATSFNTTTGIKTKAIAQGSVTFGPGLYFIGFTSNGTTGKFGGGNGTAIWSLVSSTTATANGTTSGGAFTTITNLGIPAANPAANAVVPVVGCY